MDDYISERDAIGYLKNAVALQTLRGWRAAKKGPPYHKIGSKVFYKKRDLDAWVESRVVKTAA